MWRIQTVQKKRNSVLGIGKRTRKWSLALLVAVTVIASAGLSGSVGGRVETNAAGSVMIGGPGDMGVFRAFVMGESRLGGAAFEAFEIKDFSFGVENPTTIGSATGGAGAGKIKFNEFQIKKTSDKASPVFFKNCATGEHFKSIVLKVMKVDKKGMETPFFTYALETVFTTKIDWSGPGDEGPEESITFVYGKLTLTYHAQDSDGAGAGDVSYSWDQVTNREG